MSEYCFEPRVEAVCRLMFAVFNIAGNAINLACDVAGVPGSEGAVDAGVDRLVEVVCEVFVCAAAVPIVADALSNVVAGLRKLSGELVVVGEEEGFFRAVAGLGQVVGAHVRGVCAGADVCLPEDLDEPQTGLEHEQKNFVDGVCGVGEKPARLLYLGDAENVCFSVGLLDALCRCESESIALVFGEAHVLEAVTGALGSCALDALAHLGEDGLYGGQVLVASAHLVVEVSQEYGDLVARHRG